MCSAGWTRSERDEARVPLLRCSRCGLARAGWRVPQRESEQLYASYSYESETAWEVPKANLYSLEEWLRQMEAFRLTGRWLDVGCGAGTLLTMASRAGWSAEGTELSTVAGRRLQREGLGIHIGFLPSLALPRDSYDVVTMTELLEHVPDAAEYLDEAQRLIRPGGVLYVTTPNFDSIRRRWCGVPEVVQPPGHLWGFTQAGLRALLRRSGFLQACVWTEGLDPFALLGRLRHRAKATAPAATRLHTDALRQAAHERTLWRVAKAVVNGTMRATNLGDTLKALAVKSNDGRPGVSP
jgi:2-polyprenyl-3-methyl-5-hydroxy-6-metoxy-1,4-benzoquinol methylase